MHPVVGGEPCPYVSIVVVARDAESTQRFLDTILAQIQRHSLSVEVILVDAADNLTVPPEVRRVTSGAPVEWTARNAGIRCARGEFVLCTTVRAELADELVSFLAARKLDAQCFYRAQRKDLDDSTQSVISPGSGIQFPLGSYTAGRDDQDPFLWLESGAELILRVPSGGGILRMELEPAGTAEPVRLQVLEVDGKMLAEWTIRGRNTVRIFVPPVSGGVQRIQLCAENRPDLVFRVFRCDWYDPSTTTPRPTGQIVRDDRPLLMRLLGTGLRGVAATGRVTRLLQWRREDVFDCGAEFEPGPGWHYRESEAAVPFRWMEPDAQLSFCFDDGSTHLALLVEPGPALRHQPFELSFLSPDGKPVALSRVDRLTYIEFPLPPGPGRQMTLLLKVKIADPPASTAGDSRVLAYRVFACGRGMQRQPFSPAPWAAHLIRSRTAENRTTASGNSQTIPLGDFHLMARRHWMDLRGYTEFEQPCAHLDTLLSAQATQLQLREQVLPRPMRIRQPSSERLNETPYFTSQDLDDLKSHMRNLQAPMIWNRDSWGSGDALPARPEDPYISIVVAARNDNHGGNMLARMQAFLDSWIGQAKRYSLPSEMIVVEWNPPADRGPLKDELRWPQDLGPCAVRFIQASAEVHRSFQNASAIPLHQMIAKNAGIRRARGQFVMATNLDIVFSPELMQFLAARQLDPRAMYRMDRYDVANRIPPDAGLDELLDFCKSNVIRVAAREGTFDTDGSNIRPVETNDILSPDSGIRLGKGWYELDQYPESPWMRYFEPRAIVHFHRPGNGGRIVFDLEVGPSAMGGSVDLDVLDSSGSVVATAKLDGRHQVALSLPADLASGIFLLETRNGGVPLTVDPRVLDLRVFGIRWEEAAVAAGWKFEVVSRQPAHDWVRTNWQSPYAGQMRDPRYLHSNASGDFTMLSRDAWFAIRGYPEFPFWPTHLDSLLCWTAYHAGIREVVLRDPMRIFHVDHAAIWTPGSEEERSARAAKIGVSLIGYLDLVKYFHYMRRFNAPLILTLEDWGLRDVELPERAT
jgi:hypothetical protein